MTAPDIPTPRADSERKAVEWSWQHGGMQAHTDEEWIEIIADLERELTLSRAAVVAECAAVVMNDYGYSTPSELTRMIERLATAPAGYVCVPVEPTKEMLEAANACDIEGEDDEFRAYRIIYKAMIGSRDE